MTPLLEVRGLTKLFGEGCEHCLPGGVAADEGNRCGHCGTVVGCGDVSLEVHPGEVLGVVGESGSGKSTLVRLIHFEYEATAGEVYLNNGQDTPRQNLLEASSFRRRQVRSRTMGIVYQNPYLGLRMQVSSGGNIAEKLLAAGWRNVSEIRRRASDLLRRTEIPVERMDEPPANFSGGMQQRVQIAKALSNNPQVLLLDEVTTGLDLSVQARVLDLIRSLQRELGIAMIVVSHDLGVIRLLCQRTLVMRHGRVVESGLTDQIFEDPQHGYTQLLVSSQL
ncbi:MAG TPA: ATP-binding cassette domain-containing protein [Syntrophales bacterium]|nr:ATP-binding cassette domain-containing protein [Syntrophobacterales bacterium]HQL91595.1 ATP-binding cassette domain-containing protein [Syntrophales bacterium]